MKNSLLAHARARTGRGVQSRNAHTRRLVATTLAGLIANLVPIAVLPVGQAATTTQASPAIRQVSLHQKSSAPIAYINPIMGKVAYNQSPADLIALAKQVKQSVAALSCADQIASAWSVKVVLTEAQQAAGYKSFLITNYENIKNCLTDGKVLIGLAKKPTVAGKVWVIDKANDLAAILTPLIIPGLEWVGTHPEIGYWVGVMQVYSKFLPTLSTGIISSTNDLSETSTTTATLGPKEISGVVFDNTGRVLGTVWLSYPGTEGFGVLHNSHLLCAQLINCTIVAIPKQ